MRTIDRTVAAALPLVLACASAAAAQQLQDRPVAPPPPTSADAPAVGEDQVQFSAGALEYDYEGDVVTATGDVRMFRGAERLRADKVTWNRKTGKVLATGGIAVANPQGDVAYGDQIELTDTLKDGVIDNLLLVMERGGRIAARRGVRDADGTVNVTSAAYTACAVTDAAGCPKEPTWKITAVRVTYRPDRERIYYVGGRFHLFGLSTFPLPKFSQYIGEGSESGLLTPSFRLDRVNGFEAVIPYYLSFGPNRGLTLAPHVFSDVLPMMQATYRELNEKGALSVTGYATSSRRSDDFRTPVLGDTEHAFRGYIDASGRFQFDPSWSLSGSMRLATDRTFLRRYDISRDDRLRTTLNLERIDQNSYFSLAGWAVQSLRLSGDRQGLQPVALPVLDYRRRFPELLAGGTVELELNTLALSRKAGQDTQRAFVGARWDLRRLTRWGQEVTFTAYARGDAYNSQDTLATLVPSYRGTDGFQTRAIGALAADVKWPFVGGFLGGTQRLTPRVQLVAQPRIANLIVPNEDSRAIELDDSNLFALNRFAGYDRWEDASRVTYGGEWAVELPGVAFNAVIGQSYRFDTRPSIFPDGTGLTDRFSDYVGRTELRFRDYVSLTHRYRLDKDSFELRRNEIDATIGSRRTYLQAGYLRLNRDIDDLEDLQDREEARIAGRVQVARFWSAFASGVIDLTDRREDPLSLSDGFDPLRHRVGVAYEDDCLELGLTWRRDYRTAGDARRGNSYLLTLAFKNLGR